MLETAENKMPCPFEKLHPSQLNRDDEFFMTMAFNKAIDAWEADEVPVGAVIAHGEELIASARNETRRTNDPTAHAEMIAITQAANAIGDWRLNECRLYVTKEPCPMCAGAIINSRLKMVVFGCYDEKEGCCGSLYQLCGDPRFATTVAVKGGILDEDCSSIIKEFFQLKRNKNK